MKTVSVGGQDIKPDEVVAMFVKRRWEVSFLYAVLWLIAVAGAIFSFLGGISIILELAAMPIYYIGILFDFEMSWDIFDIFRHNGFWSSLGSIFFGGIICLITLLLSILGGEKIDDIIFLNCRHTIDVFTKNNDVINKYTEIGIHRYLTGLKDDILSSRTDQSEFYDNEKIKFFFKLRKYKSTSYLLLVFFGFLFFHRLYLRQYFLFFLNLIVLAASGYFAFVLKSFDILNIWGIFWIAINIVDIFLIPRMVRECNFNIATRLGLNFSSNII